MQLPIRMGILSYTTISSSLRLIFSLLFLNFPLIDFQSFMNGSFFAFAATFLSSVRTIEASFPAVLVFFTFVSAVALSLPVKPPVFLRSVVLSALVHLFLPDCKNSADTAIHDPAYPSVLPNTSEILHFLYFS